MRRPRMQYQKLPGSHKQRNRARNLLKCQKAGDKWLVYGGEASHYVTQNGSEFECDCGVCQNENKLCSHIIKVKMELSLFPLEPVLVPVQRRVNGH